MSLVRISGKEYDVNASMTLEELARFVHAETAEPIVLAMKDGVLRELFRTVGNGGEIHFITTADPVGNATYQRSVIFLMVKAVSDVAPERAADLYVEFSVSNGLFIRFRSGDVDAALAEKVAKRMRELQEANLPFTKESISTRYAISLFKEMGMTLKSKLFEYRRASETKIYHLGDCTDYYFAYIVPSTGYLTTFNLIPYHGGLILQTPKTGSPDRIEPYVPQEKLFATLKDAADWSAKLELNGVGELNERLVKGGVTELILFQEAIMEKRIGDIAEMIQKSGKRIVMIAGPSSSGKTTFSLRLSVQLQALGLRPHAIACDDFFKNRSEYPVDENGQVDFEAISCVDRDFLTDCLNRLLHGEEVKLPTYNFTSGEREFRGKKLKLQENDIVVLEGIHCLNEELTENLPKSDKFKIYISALTQLNVDEHNRIPTTDGRLLRRIIRDARTRGYSAEDTIERWDSVRRGEDRNIFPYQEECDVMFNSALIYELSVMKPYVEPLLYSVPKDSPAYVEAKRLLKFLDYFLAIPAEDVPKNSLVREFIGGGIFDI